MTQILKQFHRGMPAVHPRPNVYRRTPRETTNAYLAEMERRAAGIEAQNEQTAKLYRTLRQAAAVLVPVALVVAAWVLR